MKSVYVLVLAVCIISSQGALAGPPVSSTVKEKFNGLFLTAAYSTALGGGIGAAALAFEKHPKEKLRYIPLGAAIGFLSGTLFGSYFIFVPSFSKPSEYRTDHDDLEGFSEITQPISSGAGLAFYPTIDLSKKTIDGWMLDWTVATF